MVKKIRCVVDGNSWVKAKPYPLDKEVMISFFEGENMGYIWLTPSDARKLRKQIKKALEAIEGVEEESKQEPRTEENGIKHKVGDQVRIVGNKYPTNNRHNALAGPHGHGSELEMLL